MENMRGSKIQKQSYKRYIQLIRILERTKEIKKRKLINKTVISQSKVI